MRFNVFLGCSLLATTAIADNLVLDGKTIPLQTNSTVSINVTTGDVFATSQSGDLICAPPTPDVFRLWRQVVAATRDRGSG